MPFNKKECEKEINEFAQKITINGVEGCRVEKYHSWTDIEVHLPFNKEEQTMVIQTTDSSCCLDVFNQMLFTFRFLNLVVEYLKDAELQCETVQKENIATALNDILDLSEEQLKERRYQDYMGKENQWDLPTLIYRHFAPIGPPIRPGVNLGNNFFHDVKSEEVQKQVKEILKKGFCY